MKTTRRRTKTTRGKRPTQTTRAKGRKVKGAKGTKTKRAKVPTAARVRAALRADRTMTLADRRRIESTLPAIRRIAGA